MADPGGFLHALAQSLSVMALYPSGHPSRERAVDQAYQHADGLSSSAERRAFTFLDDEVVYGREPLRDFKGWDWAAKFVEVGIQRIEFERRITKDEFDGFLEEILARVAPTVGDTSEQRQMRSLGIRFGSVSLEGQAETVLDETTLDITLGDEAETFRCLQDEIRTNGIVPLLEAEAVVRSLSVAMHADRRMIMPLLQLKEFDQYTTTHALNVAVLSMALAQSLGVPKRQIRAVGIAGLLHDIGKVRIPIEVLTKPGKLTDEERALMNRHPVDAARMILESEEELELAAVVAYEHHIMLNGGGYPSVHYARECTLASRLVHVCDVFDALSTTRPYREAWPQDKVLSYLEERSGTEFDPALVGTFKRMMVEGAAQVRVLREELSAARAARAADTAVPPAPSAPVPVPA
jgi:putative nucleotidyltransferase with HDIG domain